MRERITTQDNLVLVPVSQQMLDELGIQSGDEVDIQVVNRILIVRSIEDTELENIVQGLLQQRSSVYEQVAVETQNKADRKLTSKNFLLSVAGTFSSGTTDTSENVKSIVADALLKKYGTQNA